MEAADSVLEAIFQHSLDGDDYDVEMLDAETPHSASVSGSAPSSRGGGAARSPWLGPNKKKKKKSGSGATTITDINRFVIDTCRRLREKKPYLVWNAVGCLGVSALSDLVKEVEIIQDCGGQMTADGSRCRTGGGILWNILKSRDPKIYNEIMAKGREFEKQFREPKRRRTTKQNQEKVTQSSHASVNRSAGDTSDSSEHMPEVSHQLEPSELKTEHITALNRIRVPVAYDDLYEEGEIHEATLIAA